MSINTNTWTEATDGLTNNERGVLWSLINPQVKSAMYARDRGGQGFYYPEVKRTTDPSADLHGYRNGVRVKDGKQIAKALKGLEAKGYIIITPRTGVTTRTPRTRHFNATAPLTFTYLAEEYAKWWASPSWKYGLEWYEVMHVRVPLAAELREAIAREREQAMTAAEDAEYNEAKRRLDNEPQRLAAFVALMDEYREKYGDGSLPVEERESYSGNTYLIASDMLRRIESEAKALRSWIDYHREGDVDTVAKREAARVEVTA